MGAIGGQGVESRVVVVGESTAVLLRVRCDGKASADVGQCRAQPGRPISGSGRLTRFGSDIRQALSPAPLSEALPHPPALGVCVAGPAGKGQRFCRYGMQNLVASRLTAPVSRRTALPLGHYTGYREDNKGLLSSDLTRPTAAALPGLGPRPALGDLRRRPANDNPRRGECPSPRGLRRIPPSHGGMPRLGSSESRQPRRGSAAPSSLRPALRRTSTKYPVPQIPIETICVMGMSLYTGP